jgi:hypothetical protein
MTNWITRTIQRIGTFAPGRTLLVAKSWPANDDPAVHFTTIAAALAQAATMSPSITNPINIEIHSGVYTENLTLISNVHLTGIHGGLSSTQINGTMAWTPGTGVNASQTTLQETLNLSYLNILFGANTFTYDATSKTSNASNATFTEIVFQDISATGRSAGSTNDNLFFFNCNMTSGTVSFTNVSAVTPGVEIVSTRFRSFTAAGDSTVRVQGGEMIQPVSGPVTLAVTGTAQVFLQGLNINNPMTVASGCSLTANGCALSTNSNVTLTVASGGTADVRDTNYQANARLIGPGTINRSVWHSTTDTTSAGANTVTIDPPYPEATYNVHLQLVSGAGNAAATVTGKLGTGFTLTDSVGTNVFDYTVLQEG